MRLPSGLIVPDNEPANSAGFFEKCILENNVSILSLLKNINGLGKIEKDWLDYYFSIGTNRQDYLDYLNGVVWEHKMPTASELLNPAKGFLSEPMIESIFPHIKEAFIEAMNTKDPYSYIVSYGSTRCEGKGTKILMYDMSIKNIEDVRVGDKLMGDDGTVRNVLSLHSGYGDLYKVEQDRGDDYIVNANHVLTLYNSRKDIIEDIDLQVYLKSDTRKYSGVKTYLITGYPLDMAYSTNNIKVSYHGKGEYYGFELDQNHRYVHSDYTVTHNTGKSFLAHLFVLYTTIYMNYLRSPQLYFGKAPTAEFSLYLVSFKDDKTSELLLTPILKMLDASPIFKRERFEDKVRKSTIDKGVISFSEASKFADITFPKFSIASGSNPSDFIGGNIVAGVISELLHFRRFVSISDEDVMRVFSQLFGRIKGTVGYGKKFPSYVYLDSSANDADSKVENYITTKLRNNPSCYYKDFVRWEVLPDLFPKWANANIKLGEDLKNPATWVLNEDGFSSWSTEIRTEETFRVCIGSGDIQAFIVEDDTQIEGIDKKLIIRVPNDAREDFETDLITNIHDIAGKASSSDSKFIPSRDVIDSIFDKNIENVIAELICGTEDDPELLIWNKVVKQFFVNEGSGYRIRRAPKEPRWLSLDLAKSFKGDLACLAMAHKELKQGQIVVVTDFTLVFAPDKKGINLEAINRFIMDLVTLGNIRLLKVTADRALSDTLIQNLDRAKIGVANLSVDTQLEPYLNLLSMMYNRTTILGRNIYVKNNLDSLHRIRQKNGKEKIEHTIGKVVHKYNGNFEMSECGVNDKDASDCWCAVNYIASSDLYIPITSYNDENVRLFVTAESVDKSIKETMMIEKFRNIQRNKLGAVLRRVR